MMFLRIFKHLLPNARAWRVTVDKKLRQFFEGLSGTGDNVKSFFDGIWGDLFPETTREISAWERQFGLPGTELTEQQRRDRLSASWKALGGQDPRYIQDTLRENGFDVYVHEWWEPSSTPEPGVKICVEPRNPLLWLRRESSGVATLVDCGEPMALCGEAFAEAGNGLSPRGYPLVNKIIQTEPDFLTVCGESIAEAGGPEALSGNYFVFVDRPKEYIVPANPDKWPYFLYIGAETFGELAQVTPSRRDEFEALCLKICPTQQWLGILVEYN
tara:strand:+ start:7363 stop:8178 length:816 start_codon:yes stop_codon:yes gene_type:complete